MRAVDVTIPVPSDESVSGVLEIPQGFDAGRTAAVILAHGAGNDMHTPLLVHFSAGLCRAGYLSLRFNFPYKEKGQKAPDPQEKLVRTWQAAFGFIREHPQYRIERIVAAGKSMGGRIASQMATDGLISPKALVFLGYPLHPPGNKEQLRDAHLYRINIPMLFFAGTRDALCDLELLKPVVKRLNASTELEVIEGGDHSFVLPKSFKISEQEVLRRDTEAVHRLAEASDLRRDYDCPTPRSRPGRDPDAAGQLYRHCCHDGTAIVQRSATEDASGNRVSVLAEHGFSAVVSLTAGGQSRKALFDFGFSATGALQNARTLGVDLAAIEALVLSHGHMDHHGGLPAFVESLGGKGIELVLHPAAFRGSRYLKLSEERRLRLRPPTVIGLKRRGCGSSRRGRPARSWAIPCSSWGKFQNELNSRKAC